jgi:hypothetical protein
MGRVSGLIYEGRTGPITGTEASVPEGRASGPAYWEVSERPNSGTQASIPMGRASGLIFEGRMGPVTGIRASVPEGRASGPAYWEV